MTVCGEKITGVCIAAKCPHFKRCCPVVWDKYGKIKPMTKEKWLCQLSTEEKAKWITENLSVYADDWVKRDEKLLNPATWVDWLNEVHK
jgi:hypothetical protein